MKSNIVINIGLESFNGSPVELHTAIHEIERAGITCLASGVVTGQWEGKEEQTLVICGLAYDSPELRPRLYCASRALSQHCIAVWRNGAGELVGENPTGHTFNAELFHFHPREEQSPPSECQAMQAKHLAKFEEIKIAGYNAPKGDCLGASADSEFPRFATPDKFGESREFPLLVNGWSKECFLDYLRETLIPDLKKSGSEATAEDFENAVEFIEG